MLHQIWRLRFVPQSVLKALAVLPRESPPKRGRVSSASYSSTRRVSTRASARASSLLPENEVIELHDLEGQETPAPRVGKMPALMLLLPPPSHKGLIPSVPTSRSEISEMCWRALVLRLLMPNQNTPVFWRWMATIAGCSQIWLLVLRIGGLLVSFRQTSLSSRSNTMKPRYSCVMYYYLYIFLYETCLALTHFQRNLYLLSVDFVVMFSRAWYFAKLKALGALV